jgi:alpha-amylase
VGLDLPAGRKELSVRGVFPDGTVLRDYYSGQQATVARGKVAIVSGDAIVLLGK